MIETKRIKLVPLSSDQLIIYINDYQLLEKELGLNHTERIISTELKEALQVNILPSVKNKNDNYLFSTLWTVIDKEHNRMVADICFKGEPDDDGEVEIGYGTYNEYQGKGFMTETIKAISKWVFKQEKVKYIYAETDKKNNASEKVLVRNNFIKVGEKNNLYLWKLYRNCIK